MFVLTCEVAASLFITTVSAIAIPFQQDLSQSIAASAPYNLSVPDSRLISQLNTTTAKTGPSQLLNTTVPKPPLKNDQVLIDCSYGHELEYDSCLDALNTFVYPRRNRPLTIGQRFMGGVCQFLVRGIFLP
jgi:hypothetical protein